jgi:hypothetical protein
VDKRLVPAPYYSFSLRFNVSVSVHGSIFIADTEQVEEFKRVVNAALQSPLTVAERKRWEADNEFIKCCAANDPMASVFELAGSEESRKADRYYHEIREAIAAPRRLIDYGHSSLCQHEEVLDGLIRLGATLLKAA